MTLLLTEEQQAIQKTAREFVQARMPIAHLRALRDAADPIGFSRASWRELARLGLAAVTVPEAHGGTGLGYAELGLVLEECGRQLAPTPHLSTVVLGAGAIQAAGTEAQRRAWLGRIAAGEAIVALAHEEGTRHAPWSIATRAERRDGGFVLHGAKVLVIDGMAADAFVVVARTGGAAAERAGLSLFLVEAASTGLARRRSDTVDSRGHARVTLDGVAVAPDARLGSIDDGAAVLEPLLDRARVALAAEMLGALQEGFARTVAYLKERRQFGVPIGSFQALKHRAAQMFCEVELCRSIVLDALRAVDAARDDLPRVASAAKARANDTFLLVANEAIQMHGGIGVTDEMDIGFYLKRARVAEQLFGTSSFHRDRYARLQGF